MLELAFAGGQSLRNLVQAMRPPQLTKQHGNELAPTAEAPGMTLGLVLPHRLLKFAARKQLQQLAENTAYFHHGGQTPFGSTSSQRKP
jgi:hypothetical protein